MKCRFLILAFPLMMILGCQKVDVTYWPNGNKKSEISMKGGNYHGPATFWFEDGTVQTSCNYQDNQLEGTLISRHSNGAVQAEQSYRKGKLHGLAKGYDSYGKLGSEANYLDGVLHGRYTEYYPGFGIKLEGNYNHGDHEGTWLYYDVGGKIIGEGVFVKGSGTQRSFWENGQTKQSTQYKENRKHGDEIFYRSDGSVEYINKYSDGKLVEKVPGQNQKK